MAMSQGERISRLLAPGGRYLSNKQTRDSSELTQIVQARASGKVFAREAPNGTFSVQTTIGEDNCCRTIVQGSQNFSGYTGLNQAAQKCAICATPDYATRNGYATDLSGGTIRGGYVAPWAPLPNTAKTTVAEQCASCKRFYFPGQPACCPNPYTTNYIDTFDDRYGGNKTTNPVP